MGEENSTLTAENSELKNEIKDNREMAEKSILSADKELEFERKIQEFKETGISNCVKLVKTHFIILKCIDQLWPIADNILKHDQLFNLHIVRDVCQFSFFRHFPRKVLFHTALTFGDFRVVLTQN